MNEFDILSINISKKKGIIKTPINEAVITKTGILHDAHADNWHRQISLLAIESINKFSEQAKRKFNFGEFAENITTQGISLINTAPLDILKIGEVVLEITQLGKKCHGDNCAIYRAVGKCVMPKEGIFARVVKEGKINTNIRGSWHPKTFNIKVITLSERASSGIYKDLSGPAITKNLQGFFDNLNRKHFIENIVIPDDKEKLLEVLKQCEISNIDLIFTTGGTGIGHKDITTDVIENYADKIIPGIMEYIRVKYGSTIPSALLSRSIAATKGKTAIFALPGSLKAVNEYFLEIQKNLLHIIYTLNNIDLH